ncbi:MAG: hypothetical protein ACOYD0_13070 [Candidatus Nanopelagicales bacterium]
MPQYYDPITGKLIEQQTAKGRYFNPVTGEEVSEPPKPSHPLATLGDAVVDTVKGAGKSFLNTGSQLGNWAARIGFIPGVTDQMAEERRAKDKALLAPTNTAQKVGGYLEQAGEFVLPGLGAEKVGIGLAKALPWAEKAPKLFQVGARAITEGLTGAGVTAAQGGDPLSGGIVSAALPVAGSVLAPVARVVKNSAVKSAEKFLGPIAPGSRKLAKEVATGIVDRGETSLIGTQGKMLERAGKSANTAVSEINRVSKELTGRTGDAAVTVPTAPIRNVLDKELAKTTIVNPAGETVVVPGKAAAHNALTEIKTFLDQFGDNLSAADAIAFKSKWGNVGFGTDKASKAEAAAAKKAWGALKDGLKGLTDDLTQPGKDYHFWKSLEELLGKNIDRKAPNTFGDLGRNSLRAFAAGLFGGFAAGGPLGAAAGSITGPLVSGALRTPTGQLAKAQIKSAASKGVNWFGKQELTPWMTRQAIKNLLKGGTSSVTQDERE